MNLPNILAEARACTVCAGFLPLGPRPLLAADPASRVLIIGQAPGRATHEAGVPWQDRSGDRLRAWLGVTPAQFYDASLFALIPTGFCYPGSRPDGSDLPPRPECAPLWHPQLLPALPEVRLTVYLGTYAVESGLGARYQNLSAAAAGFRELLPTRVALPHPSPRTAIWANQRPWFAAELLPALRARIQELLA